MKLKSKLIATIVSICAAIAVMGVGVWAASANFSVTVTNTVSLAFAGIDGKVEVKAEAEQFGATTSGEGAVNAATPTANLKIYDSADSTKVNAVNVGNCTLAGFFDDEKGYINGDTKAAALMYTFTYTASTEVAEGAAVIGYKVTSTGNAQGTIAGKDAFAYSYYINGGSGFVKMETNTEYFVDASKNVTIIAVCQYTNDKAASIKVEGSWVFTLAMAAYSETTGTLATAAGNKAAITNGAFAVTETATNEDVATTKVPHTAA